jgi:hypothetical protein
MKRVFIGINDVSGFGVRFKRCFDKMGVKSNFYSFTPHVYGFEMDKVIKFSNNWLMRKIQKIILMVKLILKYDYFIFIGPFTLLPGYKDIRLFKFFRKKTMMLFVGCDVRMPEEVMKYKWNPCRECTQEFQKFVGCVIDEKKKYIREIEGIFDIVAAPFEATGYLQPPFHNAIFPFDTSSFPPADKFPYKQNKVLKIFHAPSNQVYKGSKYIISAIEKLKKKYEFEFHLVQNVSFEKYREELAKSDLVIDQMLLGSYGSVAIEAFLMNKPVIAYLREDMDVVEKEDCPVINANPDTLYSVLDNILAYPEQLIKIAGKGRNYVEKYHADATAVKRFYDMFENYKRN